MLDGAAAQCRALPVNVVAFPRIPRQSPYRCHVGMRGKKNALAWLCRCHPSPNRCKAKKTKKALARNAKTYPSPSAAGNPSTLRLHPQSPGLPEWDR